MCVTAMIIDVFISVFAAYIHLHSGNSVCREIVVELGTENATSWQTEKNFFFSFRLSAFLIHDWEKKFVLGSSKRLFRFSSHLLIINMQLDSLKSYNKARNDISCDICTIGNRFNKLL